MTENMDDRYAQTDTTPTPHEEEVAQIEEGNDAAPSASAHEDVQQASGRDADADLADDMTPGDESTR